MKDVFSLMVGGVLDRPLEEASFVLALTLCYFRIILRDVRILPRAINSTGKDLCSKGRGVRFQSQQL